MGMRRTRRRVRKGRVYDIIKFGSQHDLDGCGFGVWLLHSKEYL